MNETYCVIDSNYKNSEHIGLAASWLLWELGKYNIQPVSIEYADIILMTVSSQQGITDCKRALKNKKKNAIVIIGGGGCYAPAIFENIADYICVGEGVNFIHQLLANGIEGIKTLNETWVQGEIRKVIPARDFAWDMPAILHPDGIMRVFGSRGCKYKCLFCQTGWENDYRVNPHPEILEKSIRYLQKQGKKFVVVTNDGAETDMLHYGKQEFLSMRFQNIKKIMPLSSRDVKSVRIGVEGVSNRIRLAVGKPVDNDELLEAIYSLGINKVSVRLFFVVGLPGETKQDYDELKYLINGLKKMPKTTMFNFHAFIPQPATPLCVFPLKDEYWEWYDDFRTWFFDGTGFTRKVQIVNPAQYNGRMDRAKESMCATEEELRRGWFNHDNKNWRVQYLYPPDRLRHIASKYASKLDMQLDY